MIKKEMIAMLLAGGQGSRLGVLTSKLAKPAFIEIARKLANIKNLNVSVDAVSSIFWGNSISVAGLVTSDDLIKTLKALRNL